MKNFLEAIITFWSLGGFILMLATINKTLDFLDYIKSTPKQILFGAICLVLYGPLSLTALLALGTLAGILVGGFMGFEWLITKIQTSISKNIKQWFLK